jgi:hypothetical protein
LLASGNADISKAEQAFKDAALATGNEAFLAFLSGLREHAPTCPECGGIMRSQGRRGKRIVSMLGEGYISRSYYECEECGAHIFPKDEALGMSGTSFTPGVKSAVARLAASEPFESASRTLWALCGVNVCSKDTERIAESIGETIEAERISLIEDAFSEDRNVVLADDEPVPVAYIEYDGTGIPARKTETYGRAGKNEDGVAKTREIKTGCIFTQHGTDEGGRPVRDKDSTTYFAAIEKADAFGQRVYAEAMRRGAGNAGRRVVIGDGAKWIWNIADTHFPNATQIVDLYHAKEHICGLLREVLRDETERKLLNGRMYALLEAGRIDELIAMMSALPAKGREHKEFIRTETAYFKNNAHRMKYASFRQQGLFVGSGVIEAGCKNVIGKRLKQSGMHWSVRGANSIAALRCAVISGDFDNQHLCSSA